MSRDNRDDETPFDLGNEPPQPDASDRAQDSGTGGLNNEQRATNEQARAAHQQTASGRTGQERHSAQPQNIQYGANAPYNEGAEEAEDDESDQENRCVFIGPSQSGKTFLLLAIGRSCYMQSDGEFFLEFIPAPSVTLLMERSVKIITGRDRTRKGSENATDLLFEVHARAKAPHTGRIRRLLGFKRVLRESVTMNVCDGPGGALFIAEADEDTKRADEIRAWQPHLERQIRRANTLVICVDASHSTSAQSDRIEMYLPGLISRTARRRRQGGKNSRGRFSQLYRRAKNFFLRLLNRSEEAQYKICLKADRVLLLLNKVDSLCSGFERPDRVAEVIDPVEQAREMLGVPLLNMIKHGLKSDAAFAVGVTSALGFHPANGRPIANENGIVDYGAVQSGESVLRQWTPFGIRDALLFITTGQATGKVRLLTSKDLLVDDEDTAMSVVPARSDFAKTGF